MRVSWTCCNTLINLLFNRASEAWGSSRVCARAARGSRQGDGNWSGGEKEFSGRVFLTGFSPSAPWPPALRGDCNLSDTPHISVSLSKPNTGFTSLHQRHRASCDVTGHERWNPRQEGGVNLDFMGKSELRKRAKPLRWINTRLPCAFYKMPCSHNKNSMFSEMRCSRICFTLHFKFTSDLYVTNIWDGLT